MKGAGWKGHAITGLELKRNDGCSVVFKRLPAGISQVKATHPMSGTAHQEKRKMSRTIQIGGAALTGAPSDQLKAAVLDTVYHLDGLKVLSGFQFLAAEPLTTNAGRFVVAGNFGRDHFN